uniref:DUF7722 domain-containing protein n=1 Tax=Davidia involucrata TaxID=16924 RepID=A0A5B7BA53_DAVIN
MALKWFLNSAYTIVFGNSSADVSNQLSENIITCPKGKQIQGIVENTKEMMTCSTEKCPTLVFQMPLHYPRYTKADYEKMEEWKVDMILREYGLSFEGTLQEKRSFAVGAFIWPDQRL